MFSSYIGAFLVALGVYVAFADASIQLLSCVSDDGATLAPFATTIQSNSISCNTALFTEPLVDWDGLGVPPAQFHGNDVCGEQVFFDKNTDGSLDVQLGPNPAAIIGSCTSTTVGASVTCGALEGTGTTTCMVVYDCDDTALC